MSCGTLGLRMIELSSPRSDGQSRQKSLSILVISPQSCRPAPTHLLFLSFLHAEVSQGTCTENSPTWPLKAFLISIQQLSSQWIKYSSDFCKFVINLVALPKIRTRLLTLLISLTVGRINKAASSAYRLVWMRMKSAPIGVRLPACVERSSSRCIVSIAKINSIGDNGSPCLNPLPCLIAIPGMPFNRIRDDVVAQISEMISLHLCPSPSRCSISSIYSQHTLSKAFAFHIIFHYFYRVG